MASELSRAIAHRLFTSGNTTARRLVLEERTNQFKGYSGWGELPVADQLDAELQEVREAIAGVLRVADRKTVEFDRLRAVYQRLIPSVTQRSN